MQSCGTGILSLAQDSPRRGTARFVNADAVADEYLDVAELNATIADGGCAQAIAMQSRRQVSTSVMSAMRPERAVAKVPTRNGNSAKCGTR